MWICVINQGRLIGTPDWGNLQRKDLPNCQWWVCWRSGLPNHGLHLYSQWIKRQEEFELKTSLCYIGRLCTNIRSFWPATTLYSIMVVSCWVISVLNLCRWKCPLSHSREFWGLFTSPCEMCIFSVKWAGVGLPFLLARCSVNGYTMLWTVCSWRNSFLRQVLVLQPRLAPTLQSSCSCCPSAGTTDGHQHAWVRFLTCV